MPNIKERNLLQLADYNRYLYKNPKLIHLFFELTDSCNLNCLHCGSRCVGSNKTFLDFAVIEKTLIEVANKYDSSQIMICLTGGEPLLHKDIMRIIRTARSLSFPVGITTNGTLITPSVAKELKAAGLNTITISIDGLGETHNAFRNSQDAFQKAMSGVYALRAEEIYPEALTVVHKNNFRELEKLYEFFKKEEFTSWRISNIEPIGRAQENKNLMLTGSELKILLDFIQDKRFDETNEMTVAYGCSHFLSIAYENMVRGYYFQCGAGIKVASIAANGDILACLDIERRDDLVQGNVFEQSFVDVWKNEFKIFRRDKSDSSQSCQKCQHKAMCMGDSCHTWNYTTDEPTYCIKTIWEDQAE